MLRARTGITNLSDDELLLFDMLFDCSARPDQLSASAYAIHMNCDYTHSLNDRELSDALCSLLSRCLVRVVGNSANSNAPTYSLTETGGALWELERQPNWNQYVTTSQKQLGTFSTGSIVALCVDEIVGRQCLGAMFASGLITPAGSIRSRMLYDKRIVPWKWFPSIFALRCKTSDSIHDARESVKWYAYQSSRCWWRSIDELLSLRR